MKFRALFFLLLSLNAFTAQAATGKELAWQPWSPELFAQAKAQNKFVFLYLEAVWCHWCHVMQAQTLRDPAVRAALKKNYLITRVDHDAHPLLANRYRDYGWPALVFYAPDGTEIVKRAGYIAPADFTRLLTAIIKDPSPEQTPAMTTVAGASSLTPMQRQALLRLHDDSFDAALGGLKTAQKFLDRDSVEFALVHSDQPSERTKAEKTLDSARALLDPVWGGVYQYSTGGDWNHPHFEKIMRVQAGYLRTYALAYGRLKRKSDLAVAQQIRAYLFNFLRSEQGAFYVSQDADLIPGKKSQDYFALNDAQRRARGMPRIDRNLYADANALAAEALATHYQFTGDTQSLAAAVTAMQWVIRHRASGAGFRHGASPGFYLSDNLAVGRAFLQLYKVTAERSWLAHAQKSAGFIRSHFRASSAGLLSASPQAGPVQPLPGVEENISAVRFLNLLHHYTGEPAHRELAEHAMKFLGTDARVAASIEEAGILLADEELAAPPVHLTVVGSKRDASAQALFATALAVPGSYSRIEWLAPEEGALPHSDVQYPKFPRAAGYVCQNQRCSAPRFSAADYAAAIANIAKPL